MFDSPDRKRARPAPRYPLSRVCLVDDDEGGLRTLARLIRSVGYENIDTARNGKEALALHSEADIVLLDLHMPEMDGFAVLERLRATSNGVPVLVLTGDNDKASRRRALSLGATDFVNKPYDTDELVLRMGNLLELRALHKSVVRANADLERKISERTRELEEAHAEMLVRLALAAEFRDDTTGEHTWRVGFIAARIAERLGRAPLETKLLERAARLHDVGKIGIPDGILLKPGKLTEEEFEVMKNHTTIGANLLSGGRSPVLQLAEGIALSHHERWDGNGYPHGVAGEDILWEARVVAIADVFDALTHQRTYKECWPLDRAIEEISKQRGKQFDPEMADAFAELAELGVIIDVKRPADSAFRGSIPSRFLTELPPEEDD